MNYRPCIVTDTNGNKRRALFDRFYTRQEPIEPSLMRGGHSGGQVCICHAVVIYENGQVDSVPAFWVRFTDMAEQSLVIQITDDKVKSRQIKKALKDNDGYCPCRLQKVPDSKCMCKEFREQKTPGPCHCGLYIKVYK